MFPKQTEHPRFFIVYNSREPIQGYKSFQFAFLDHLDLLF